MTDESRQFNSILGLLIYSYQMFPATGKQQSQRNGTAPDPKEAVMSGPTIQLSIKESPDMFSDAATVLEKTPLDPIVGVRESGRRGENCFELGGSEWKEDREIK